MLAEPCRLQVLGGFGHVSNFALLLPQSSTHLVRGAVVLLAAGLALKPGWVGRVRGLWVDRRAAMLGRAMFSLLLFNLLLFLFLLLLRLAAFGFRLGFGVATGIRPGFVRSWLMFGMVMLFGAGGERKQGCCDEGRADRGGKEWF